MSFWKRWTSGVTAHIDDLVSRVENHEALVASAMDDLRAKTARAKARLARVRRDGRDLRDRLQAERAAVDTWRERARACTEDARALECLRRSHRARTLADTLVQRVAEHEQVEGQLDKELHALEQRVSEILQNYHVMRTRQTRAEALECLQHASAGSDIESVLERWEGKLAESELRDGIGERAGDVFETEFASAEEKATLAAELSALRGGHHD